MKQIAHPSEMQALAEHDRAQGRRLFFIPTMGALHAGHVSLIAAARAHPTFRPGIDRIVVSIFLNPIQFNDPNDLAHYPKPLDADIAACRAAQVDYLFLPTPAEMYPSAFSTSVTVLGLTDALCGKSRPGHFTGVTTVVLKLFSIVQASVAIFGEKDFQQLAVIRRMVMDLNLPVEIVAAPTYREADGLAMSSRNTRLSAEDRVHALVLFKALTLAEGRFRAGETDCARVRADLLSLIAHTPRARVDYVEFVDTDTLLPLLHYREGKTRLALAVWIGDPDPVRLIDNRLY